MFSLAFEAAQEKSMSITSPPRWDVQLWCELPLYIFSGSAKTSAGIHLIHCLAKESSLGMSKENDAEGLLLKIPSTQYQFPTLILFSCDYIQDQDNNSSPIQTRKNIKQ